MQQIEHLVSLHRLEFRNRLAFDLLTQDRSGGLTDRTAFTIKVSLRDTIVRVDLQLELDDISAERILVAMTTRGMNQLPLVIGRLEVIQNVFLVNIFRHARSSSSHVDETQFATEKWSTASRQSTK